MVREGTKAKLKALDATQNRPGGEEGTRRAGVGREGGLACCALLVR